MSNLSEQQLHRLESVAIAHPANVLEARRKYEELEHELDIQLGEMGTLSSEILWKSSDAYRDYLRTRAGTLSHSRTTYLQRVVEKLVDLLTSLRSAHNSHDATD